MTAVPDNPFPLSAVAVFDAELGPTAEFQYMRDAREPLFHYLVRYPQQHCCLALAGGHGSGKTHLLKWLEAQVAGVTTAQTQIVYAKPNSPDIAELYGLILKRLPRDRLLAVQREALIAVGARIAGAAKATEADARDLQDHEAPKRAEALRRATQTKVLDVNELQIELREAVVQGVSGADVARRVAAALGLLDDPEFGEAAYAWLTGASGVALPNEALASGLFAGEGDVASKAVPALATLAALFKVAGQRLVIFIDEMEKFLSPEDAQRKSSNLKEIVEQVGLQAAAIIMAGTPTGWELLPRDVGPRLVQRDPQRVGSLRPAECQELLDAQVRVRLGTAPVVPEPVAAVMVELAGGNPREILRIAHRAFDTARVDFAAYTPEVLIAAAKESGTLSDREALARQIIEATAREMGLIAAPAPIGYLVRTAEAALAVAFATAADPKSEAQSGRDLARALHAAGTGSAFVIAIGYSTDRVRQIIQGVADVVVFDEAALKEQLRAAFGRLKATPAPPPQAPAADPALTERLQHMDKVLASVEEARKAADRQIAQLLAERTAAAAAPQRQENELRTRSELREALDRLNEALAQGYPEDERQEVRRILIGNETYVEDPELEYLGTLYLDALDVQRLHLDRPPHWSPGLDEAGASLRTYRADLVRAMRQALLGPRAGTYSTQGGRATLAVAGALALLLLGYLYFVVAIGVSVSMELLAVMATGAGLAGLISYGALEFMTQPAVRHARLRTRYEGLRQEIESQTWKAASAPLAS